MASGRAWSWRFLSAAVEGGEGREFLSPLRILVRSFRMSRDKWKAKAGRLKVDMKRLKVNVHDLQKSRASWRVRAEVAEGELAALRVRMAGLTESPSLNTESPFPKEETGGELIAVTPGGGHDSARVESSNARGRVLWLNLVLTAHSTLRGASAVWNVLRQFIPAWPEAPDWTTGRTWLLRLGCDALRCPKERATDWISFIDHTVQIGPQKVLLILGIRASGLPVGRPLQLADLEPIALVPTRRADTAHVHQALQQATAVTGVPTAILGDHAAELVGGIAMFRQDHPQTRALYDLKHKAACLLKRRLKADPRFAEYSRQMAQCKFQVAQTEVSQIVFFGDPRGSPDFTGPHSHRPPHFIADILRCLRIDCG